jgi:hypothetical protein
MRLAEVAIYYPANQENENSDDSDGDYAIRSHPVDIITLLSVERTSILNEGNK